MIENKRMSIIDFGNALLSSGDLDPIYIMLWRAKLPQKTLDRWLIAYWCLYHSGAASKLAEMPKERFWDGLYVAAVNDGLRWPRGAERRHWRGANAVKSADDLRRRFPDDPAEMVAYIAGSRSYAWPTFAEVSARAREFVGFGPWIAFKVADMLDRVAGLKVDFSGADLAMYSEPVEGAKMYWKVQNPGWEPSSDALIRHSVVYDISRELIYTFGLNHKAPPDYKRAVNIQEIETILCKWKSHMGGHYPPGKDTAELFHVLDGWGDLAEHLKQFVPAIPG